jgi:hypothetical protein
LPQEGKTVLGWLMELNFQISLKESDDTIRIRLSGRAGVKEFLAAEFGI